MIFDAHFDIQRLAPSGAFSVLFTKCLLKLGSKHLKIDVFGQFHQRITETAQCGETITVIKETWLVAFHCQLHSKKYAKYIDGECVVIYQTALEGLCEFGG